MYSKLRHVSVSGMSACVPRDIDEVAAYPAFDEKAAKKFVRSTGIERRHKADSDTCTSDLCLTAAERLLDELRWEKDSISLLVFVSQTPDYRLPATSCILQDRLGLSKDCATVDVSNGCSGWVYGLNVCASMLSASEGKRALLLAGDTLLKICSPEDKSTWPLFGDAGTCTAIEFDAGHDTGMEFNLHSDGAGSEMIIVRGGGTRVPYSATAAQRKDIDDGIRRSDMDLSLEGMDVFSFGITRGAECVSELIEHFGLMPDVRTLYTFHQANRMLNETIRRKLRLTAEQCPYCLQEYGNTSSASIPLALVSQCQDRLRDETVDHIACGFGVGASWGSVHFTTSHIAVPEIVEV